jgi:hypothetical protein
MSRGTVSARHQFVGLLGVLGLACVGIACGSGSSSATTPLYSASCTVTLSGAVEGTLDCRPATTAFSESKGFFDFVAPSLQSDAGSAVWATTIIYFLGGPAVQTYSNTDLGALGGVDVTSGDGSIWSSALGSYQLTFTSVHEVDSAYGPLYDGEGTLDATLVPNAGTSATGNVTFHATF